MRISAFCRLIIAQISGLTERREQGVEHVAANVGAERRGGERGRAVRLGHRGDAAVPELRRRLRTHREHLGGHAVRSALELHVARERPGVELLQSEQGVAAAAARGFEHRSVVERQRRTDEILRALRGERLHVDHRAVHGLAQLAQPLRRRRTERHLFGARGHQHDDALIGLVGDDAEQTLDGGRAGVVQIVEPEEQRSAAGDPPQGVADDHAARLEGIQREADTARTDGLIGGQRAHPLRGARDPSATVLVVAPHLPAIEQRALDGVAIDALEVVVADDAAEHAVERAPDRTVARAHGHHAALFVHGLAQPLRDAALSGAGGTDQHHEAVRRDPRRR